MNKIDNFSEKNVIGFCGNQCTNETRDNGQRLLTMHILSNLFLQKN